MGNCIQLGFVAIINDVNLDNLDDNHWIVDKLSICFENQNKEQDQSVMNFWSKFPEVHNRIKSEAGPIRDKILEVKQWLNLLSSTYEITNFISDISCVDFSWFRNLYLTYSNTEGDIFQLPYKSICTYSMEECLILTCINKNQIREFYQFERFPHTHYATEDALKTAYEYLKLKLFIRNNF